MSLARSKQGQAAVSGQSLPSGPHRSASAASNLSNDSFGGRPPVAGGPSRRGWNQSRPELSRSSRDRFGSSSAAARAGSPVSLMSPGASSPPKARWSSSTNVSPGGPSLSPSKSRTFAPKAHVPDVNVRAKQTSQHYQHALRQRYEEILGSTNRTEREMRDNLKALRKIILTDGLPETMDEPNRCGLRGRIWKVLLGVQRISAAEYVSLIDRKECDVFEKIKNDTFRTLATDKKFLDKVNENMLLRVLNAFVWKSRDVPTSRLLPFTFSYVQGMNVLAAPFLYIMPELDSFFAFTTFIQETCPLYVQQSLEGAHCGMKLLDVCLYILDPELYFLLRTKNLEAKVYAMAPILTFCASMQPLDEVLVLWDFLLAYGVHLNVLAVVAQLQFCRDELLRSDSPMKILRNLPQLKGRATIDMVVNRLLPRIPDSIYDLLSRHPWDPHVYSLLQSVEGSSSPGGDGLGNPVNELLASIEVF